MLHSTHDILCKCRLLCLKLTFDLKKSENVAITQEDAHILISKMLSNTNYKQNHQLKITAICH